MIIVAVATMLAGGAPARALHDPGSERARCVLGAEVAGDAERRDISVSIDFPSHLVEGDSFDWRVSVRNLRDTPVELRFRNTSRASVELCARGRLAYAYARVANPAIGQLTLKPQEVRVFALPENGRRIAAGEYLLGAYVAIVGSPVARRVVRVSEKLGA